MKIIITGATGFVGRNLAESLHGDGFQIEATGRSLEVGNELQKKGIRFLPADIRDSAQLTNAFSSADCVIHCAAKTGDWGRYKEFYETNVVGTRNVIAACKSHDIKKIIFISTPSIYFTGKDRYNISENGPLPARQTNHYSKTKLIAETELLASQQAGFNVIILRPRTVYGPYDNTFVPRILRLAEQKYMPLINNGRAMIDLTYVDNVVDAVRKSLTASDNAWNEVYNISNGDPISVRDWFSQVLNIFERPFKPKNIPESAAKTVAGIREFVSYLPFAEKEPSMTRFSVGYMAKSMTMNTDKAKKMLNYAPQVGNQEGFKMYAEWYKSKKNG
jgi:nucleoside-diphosphate-sugar epimerase